MSDSGSQPDSPRNLWAPWRMEYIHSLSEPDNGCFLCRCRDETDKDDENLMVWRGRRTFAVMNRFPYTGGHCLVAPYEHTPDLADLPPDALTEMMEMLRDLQGALRKAIGPDGFNIGVNIGRCAGAGLPEHVHAHIVPRWTGDTNFMPVFGDVRVIPEFLQNIRRQIQAAAAELGLPKLSAKPS